MGLVVICMGMALLLAVYIGIIALAIWGVYYHLTANYAMVGELLPM